MTSNQIKMKKIIGCILVASPFIAVYFWTATQLGWLQALIPFALAVIMVACLSVGVILLVDR